MTIGETLQTYFREEVFASTPDIQACILLAPHDTVSVVATDPSSTIPLDKLLETSTFEELHLLFSNPLKPNVQAIYFRLTTAYIIVYPIAAEIYWLCSVNNQAKLTLPFPIEKWLKDIRNIVRESRITSTRK